MRIFAKYWKCCRGEYMPNFGNVEEENIFQMMAKLLRRIFSKYWQVGDENI
jgi:hypothetical protein